MSTSRCSINKLPVASATVADWVRAARSFHRVCSTVECDAQDSSFTGDVTWAADLNGHTVAMAWKWREVLPNVVALSDPLGIASNVVLVDDEGQQLPAGKRILYLNATVSRLRWQAEFRQLPRARSRHVDA